jgi:hypothetical protein
LTEPAERVNICMMERWDLGHGIDQPHRQPGSAGQPVRFFTPETAFFTPSIGEK